MDPDTSAASIPMQRDLTSMATKSYDLMIVGGGITGAAIAWDASLRGLKVALIEKDDFAHATTAGSSKLIHGGLRYLVNGEIGLVRVALRERRIWETIAPHMVFPLPFILPTYGRGMTGKLIHALGLTLYDLLSWDRNWLSDDDKKIPRHTSLSRAQALDLMPSLKQNGLTGAKLYYDCQMFAPERLCFEFIAGAAEQGADVANYARVTGFESDGSLEEGARITGVRLEDQHTRKTHILKATLTINATGPWADTMMELAEGGEPARRLIRSKGIHLITRNLSGDHALIIRSSLGGHFFVIPWRDHTILGTTDTLYEGNPDQLGVSEGDIADFLAVVNDALPGLRLSRQDVRHAYAGIRPLIETPQKTGPNSSPKDSKDSYNASRAAEIIDHKETDELDGLISAMGGKWTTSRHLAKQIVDLAVHKLDRPLTPSETHHTPLYGGEMGRYRSFTTRAIKRHSTLPPDVVEHLCHYYGSRIDELLATADEKPGERAELLQRLSPASCDLGVQIVHAARHEMALSLSDALFRRTGLGTLGHPGKDIIEKAAALMAREHNWDPDEKARQIADAEAVFLPVPNP